MATNVCTICSSPPTLRNEVNEHLLQHGVRPTWRQFPQFQLHSIWNHSRNHLEQGAVKLKRLVGNAQDLMSMRPRLESLVTKLEKIADDAMKEKDRDSAINALKEVRNNLELLGKISGEVPWHPGVSVQVNTVNVAGLPVQDKIKTITERLRTRLGTQIPPELEGNVEAEIPTTETLDQSEVN